MLTAVVGINWGDEGKGRMVDLLSEQYDVVARYQGGNNAGHTVVNDKGRFILNLLPSGVLRPEVVNVMGNGMAIDLEHFSMELKRLGEGGITLAPQNLKVSDKAVICLPYDVRQDVLEEERLKENKFGSTRRGIGPVYGDKYMKKAVRVGDLFHESYLKQRVAEIVEWKNLMIEKGYGQERVRATEMYEWLMEYGVVIKPFVCDAGKYLEDAANEGKNIMFEAQLGALRDIDFGIYPFTSSSSTLAAYAPIGSGIPGKKLDRTIGIMKAYSSCVGEGPFTAEMYDGVAERLREAGGEYGAATGRPRRVGAFDVVASRYGTTVQGADEIALTKLDVLSYMDSIPVCEAYETKEGITRDFPMGEALGAAKPVIKQIKGWQRDISGCRKMSDLPAEAAAYVDYLQDAVGRPITYISVGPEREAYISAS